MARHKATELEGLDAEPQSERVQTQSHKEERKPQSHRGIITRRGKDM